MPNLRQMSGSDIEVGKIISALTLSVSGAKHLRGLADLRLRRETSRSSTEKSVSYDICRFRLSIDANSAP